MYSLLKNTLPMEGFSYGGYTLKENVVYIDMKPDKRSSPKCSKCGASCSVYDHLPYERTFAFYPILTYPSFIRYRMRRVCCKECGIVCEKLPWASGKHQICHPFVIELATMAKELSVKSAARVCKTTEHHVRSAVKAVVEYGFSQRKLDNVKAIGIDEIAWQKGHQFISLVYQIDEGERRLISVTRDRTEESMNEFVKEVKEETPEFTSNVEVVCTDMWAPYKKVAAEQFPNARNVLDRFHIIQKFNKIIDAIRAAEYKEQTRDGNGSVLLNTRYCFVKNPENLTEKQSLKLKELLAMNLTTTKAYLLKEEFQELWKCETAVSAKRFIDAWCRTVTRTQIKKLHPFARMIKRHCEGILNYFRLGKRYSSGVVEGLNRKVNLTIRRAYGYRTFEGIKMALFHQLGNLPMPPITHRFS